MARLPRHLALELHACEYLPRRLAARRSVLTNHTFTCQEGGTYACGDVVLQFSKVDQTRFAWIVACLEDPEGELLWEEGGYQALWQGDGSPRQQSWCVSYQGGTYRLGSMRFVVKAEDTCAACQQTKSGVCPVDQRLESLLQKAENNILTMAECVQQQVSSSRASIDAFAQHLAVQFKHQNDRHHPG